MAEDDVDADADGEDEAPDAGGAENGDGEPAETVEEAEETEETEEAEETGGEIEPQVTVESLGARLDEAEESLEAAETEADLDAVDETLDAVEADLERLDRPDEDDEDAEDPAAEVEDRLADLQEGVEAERGPYAEDVVESFEGAAETVAETRWTESGEDAVAAAVAGAHEAVAEALDATVEESAPADTLSALAAAVADAGLDPDEDAETVAALVTAADDLESALEDAEEWDDLETREQLLAQGYYDVLGHYKDFPPEWAAMKEHEQRGDVEMVLLALDSFGSEFMERHALETLTRMNDEGAFEEMHARAGKRDKPGIKAIGKMGAEEAVETLVEYVDADSDPTLQKVTFRALGEIGDERATQPLANKLAMENDVVRSHAARALGMVGDTRAVRPLAATLADDEVESVRAAAAWALRQIGTRRALERAAEYVDDRSYLVAHEAEQARDALAADRDETPAEA